MPPAFPLGRHNLYMSLAEACFVGADHQVITRTAKGVSLDIAAGKLAEIVVAGFAGIAGPAAFGTNPRRRVFTLRPSPCERAPPGLGLSSP